MKTLWGKDRQGECTITHHIGRAPRSTEKELAEERKKSAKKAPGATYFDWLIAKQKQNSKFIGATNCLSFAYKNALECPSYHSMWNFVGVTHHC